MALQKILPFKDILTPKQPMNKLFSGVNLNIFLFEARAGLQKCLQSLK